MYVCWGWGNEAALGDLEGKMNIQERKDNEDNNVRTLKVSFSFFFFFWKSMLHLDHLVYLFIFKD